MPLKEYRRKRNLRKTPEPAGTPSRRAPKGATLRFVIQEHHARRLHYDFRLEHRGTMKSWAVTNQPSDDHSVRRLAIETEDHPLDYAKFHGRIPEGEYGAGVVKIWDRGTFEPLKDLDGGLDDGVVEVLLRGRRLKGAYVLVRTRGEGTRSQWLFFRKKRRPVGLCIPNVEAIEHRRQQSNSEFPTPRSKRARRRG